MNRRVAGYKARNHGQAFENVLKHSAEKQAWHPIHIFTGCEGFGKSLRMKAQQFDFVFLKNGCALFIDAKTVKTKTFAQSRITPHQMAALLKCEKQGFTAGYVVNYSEYNDTRFYSATDLRLMERGNSLQQIDGVKLGDNSFIMLDLLYISPRISI